VTPFHHSAAPAPDLGVVRRMRRLDPDLFLTWSPFALSGTTGQPLSGPTGRPVRYPQWYLWLRCPDGKTRFINSFQTFDHRNVAALESDLARFIAPRQVLARRIMESDARRKRLEEAAQGRRMDAYAANKSRIRDLFVDGKIHDRRPARAYSAPGVSSRGTPGDVPTSAKEAGWELPDRN